MVQHQNRILCIMCASVHASDYIQAEKHWPITTFSMQNIPFTSTRNFVLFSGGREFFTSFYKFKLFEVCCSLKFWIISFHCRKFDFVFKSNFWFGIISFLIRRKTFDVLLLLSLDFMVVHGPFLYSPEFLTLKKQSRRFNFHKKSLSFHFKKN